MQEHPDGTHEVQRFDLDQLVSTSFYSTDWKLIDIDAFLASDTMTARLFPTSEFSTDEGGNTGPSLASFFDGRDDFPSLLGDSNSKSDDTGRVVGTENLCDVFDSQGDHDLSFLSSQIYYDIM